MRLWRTAIHRHHIHARLNDEDQCVECGRIARDRACTCVKRLLSSVGDGRSRVTVLLADLNEWLRFGGPILRLEARFGKLPAPKTFPSPGPAFALDRIFVKPREAVTEIGVHDSGLACIASDHLPVKAVVKFG